MLLGQERLPMEYFNWLSQNLSASIFYSISNLGVWQSHSKSNMIIKKWNRTARFSLSWDRWDSRYFYLNWDDFPYLLPEVAGPFCMGQIYIPTLTWGSPRFWTLPYALATTALVFPLRGTPLAVQQFISISLGDCVRLPLMLQSHTSRWLYHLLHWQGETRHEFPIFTWIHC